MSTTRRTFVKTAAVLVVGAAVSFVGVIPPALVIEASPALAFTYPFQWWWINSDGEVYYTDCNTTAWTLVRNKETASI